MQSHEHSLDLSRIKAICFDVDGTLRDTDDSYTIKIDRFFRNVLPKHLSTRFSRWIIMKTETPANFLFSLPDRLGIDDELAAIADRIYARRKNPPRPTLIIPGIRNALEILETRYPLSVVTARGYRGTMQFLNEHSLTGYFHAIASAQTCQRTKPFPDPVLWTAAQMGVPPSNCLMVGDTTVDIIAGKKAGAQTVGVLSGFGEEKELRRKGAHHILKSVADLPQLIT
jgi:phosphoglycolate phosphatase-like HAD superfamily hydrolase